jgi:2,3-bisphosphoglycerate-dependent phosphoglycerate mutase
MTARLILLRHGQSLWNAQNLFTGFVDIGLSAKGEEEAKRAGEALKDLTIDAVFSSALKRAQDTAKIALLGRMPKEYFESACLNERHYGKLQGKNKDECRAQFGADMVQKWRRSFIEKPPGGESLKDTYERVLPYFTSTIEPFLKMGKTVLIAAHGNSLRALIMYIEHLSPEHIESIEIPTGTPVVYEFSSDLKVLKKYIAGNERYNR